jgi:hypothetical protein
MYYDKACHSKLNNTFTIFSNKTNCKREARKSTSVYFGMEGVVNADTG